MHTFWVYILGSHTGTLHVGVTGDLDRRLTPHHDGVEGGFTARPGVHRLLYFEQVSDVFVALTREKQLRDWSRAQKVRLISLHNPAWKDLAGNS